MSLGIYGSSTLTLDTKGRVIIPENLCKYARIDKEVLVIGVIKKIELWSPDILERVDESSQELSDFEDLDDEINF